MLSFGGAKNDVWISGIIAAVLNMLGGVIILSLGQRYPSMNIIDYSRRILGSWLGGAVCLILVVVFMIISAAFLRDFSELYLTFIMPDTPISVFIGFIMATAAYALQKGLQVIGRIAELLVPVIILVVVFGILCSIPNMSLPNFQPVLADGWAGIMTDALIQLPFLGMMIAWLWFWPLANPAGAARTMLASLGVVGFLLLIISASVVLVLGSEIPVYTNYHFFNLFQQIRLISIERIELLFVIIWTGTSFLAVTLTYYIAAASLKQWLGLKSFSAVLVPVGLIISVFSLSFFASYMDLRRFWGLTQMGVLAMPVQFGLPLLLLTVDIIKRRLARRANANPDISDMV